MMLLQRRAVCRPERDIHTPGNVYYIIYLRARGVVYTNRRDIVANTFLRRVVKPYIFSTFTMDEKKTKSNYDFYVLNACDGRLKNV